MADDSTTLLEYNGDGPTTPGNKPKDARLQVLLGAYRTAKLRSQELFSSVKSAIPLKLHGQQASRVYSVLAALLYASISTAKVKELEEFVQRKSLQLPSSIFNVADWREVIALAREIRFEYCRDLEDDEQRTQLHVRRLLERLETPAAGAEGGAAVVVDLTDMQLLHEASLQEGSHLDVAHASFNLDLLQASLAETQHRLAAQTEAVQASAVENAALRGRVEKLEEAQAVTEMRHRTELAETVEAAAKAAEVAAGHSRKLQEELAHMGRQLRMAEQSLHAKEGEWQTHAHQLTLQDAAEEREQVDSERRAL